MSNPVDLRTSFCTVVWGLSARTTLRTSEPSGNRAFFRDSSAGSPAEDAWYDDAEVRSFPHRSLGFPGLGRLPDGSCGCRKEAMALAARLGFAWATVALFLLFGSTWL